MRRTEIVLFLLLFTDENNYSCCLRMNFIPCVHSRVSVRNRLSKMGDRRPQASTNWRGILTLSNRDFSFGCNTNVSIARAARLGCGRTGQPGWRGFNREEQKKKEKKKKNGIEGDRNRSGSANWEGDGAPSLSKLEGGGSLPYCTNRFFLRM